MYRERERENRKITETMLGGMNTCTPLLQQFEVPALENQMLLVCLLVA